MENRLLRKRFNCGTVAVGALAIIAIFMTTISCMAVIIMEYSRYAYTVKAANELVARRVRESLSVRQVSSTQMTVTNDGSTSSLIVGVYAVNPDDKNPTYYKLETPLNVKILSQKTFTLPHPIPENWKIGVLTALGNVFWEPENE